MEKPNVMIILTDQQRYDTIHKAGFDYMITPNLDRLAEEGCLYRNAHTHNPVCQPARHDLLVGLPANAHGYFSNCKQPIKDYGLPTLPRIFSENGYRTTAIGKMHFSPVRMHHGYSEMHVMEEVPRRRQDDDYAMYLKENGLEGIQNLHGVRPHVYHTPQIAQVEEPYYETQWIKNKTIAWLEENGDYPFMMTVGYIKPHPPWDIVNNYKGIYKDRELKEPIPVSRCYPEREDSSLWYGDKDDDLQKRKIREAYYTTITMVDESIGGILDYLEKTNKRDNTLIIFTSDHGEMLQDKGYYSKSLPYDSSVRIPFIVRYPDRFLANTVCDDFVDLMDIMPTCLDVAGLTYNGDKYALYGESLCANEPKKDRSSILSAFGFLGKNRWVMARNKQYKYIYRYNAGAEEFYDLVKDPLEMRNIISNMKGSEAYRLLKEKVIQYECQWGPKGAVLDDELVTFEGTLSHGNERGKHHFWANKQFQPFYEQDKAGRGETFLTEIQKALSDEAHSGVRLNDVNGDAEWIASFKAGFHAYAGEHAYEHARSLLFKGE